MLPGEMRRLLAALVLALAPIAASTQSVLPDADVRALREVIEAQLDAFRKDDAPRAFSYATEGIRERFGNADTFLQMVRASYPVVYRPRTVTFEEPLVVQGEILQPVRMTDADGRSWLALYPMERDAAGAWRINGCRLARLAAQET
jgi:hypothetical protein